MNLLFVGLPGSGVKTAASEAASSLGRRFVDTDEVLARNLKLSLQDVYSLFTPSALSELVRKLASQLAEGNEWCIAVGDALFMDPGARRILTSSGYTVYLTCAPGDVTEPDEPAHPLLARGTDRLTGLYAQRKSLYKETADLIVEGCVTDPAKAAASAVERFLQDEASRADRIRRDRFLEKDLADLRKRLETRYRLFGASEEVAEGYVESVITAVRQADRSIKEQMDHGM